MTDQERASRGADAAGAKTLSPRRGVAIGFGAARVQPWLWGDMPRSGISCAHAPCPVVECGDENAAQHVGWTASTIQLSQERCAPASLAMHRSSMANAHSHFGMSAQRTLEMPRLHRGSASGHHAACLGVCPLPAGCGTSWLVFERSREVCSHPKSSNSVPAAPIGPLLTRARVPVCVRRRHRARRATERRRRGDGHLPCGHCNGRHHPRRPLRRPPRPLERGARKLRKIEPAHACTPRNRRERRPPQPPLPPRCPSPQSMPRTASSASSAPRSQSCTPPTRRQRAADRAAIGRPWGAAAAVAAFEHRHRSAQAAGEGRSACRGVGAVRGTRGAAAHARGVVARSLGGAIAWVSVLRAYRGHEISTVRAPRRLGGGSRRVEVGVGVLTGRARADRGGTGVSQVPPWPLASVNMGACARSRIIIEILGDCVPSMVTASVPIGL